MKKLFNINNEVVIFPNEKGIAKIVELTATHYNLSMEEAEKLVNKRKTNDGGFKEQLWVVMSVYHRLFYNGTDYLKSTWIELIYE